MRLPGPGGDQARVVERVDHLRALARLVVDLLVRAQARKDAKELTRVGSRAARGRLRSRPCPAPRFRTRRSGPGTRARTRARGSPRRGRRRGRACARSSPELDEGLPVGVHDVLVGRLVARPGTRTRLRLAHEAFSGALGNDALEGRWLQGKRGVPRLVAFPQLRDGELERLPRRAPRVPRVGAVTRRQRGRMLHERHALPLDRVRDERLRALGIALAETREHLA